MYYFKGKTHSPLPKLTDRSQSRLDKLKTFFLPERSVSTRTFSRRAENRNEQNQMLTEYQGDLVEIIIPKKATKRSCNLKKVMPQVFQKPRIVIKEEESINLESDSAPKSPDSQQEVHLDISAIKQAMLSINNKLNADESFFGFIKKKEKLRDIAENFGDLEQNFTNPGHFYCKNDNLFPKRIDDASHLKEDKLINLTNLGVGEKYYPLIKILLQKQQNVKQLIFQGNKINDKLFLSLVQCFPPIMKDLNLKDNQLGSKGVHILAEHLSRFQNLKILNIANNFIGDHGANNFFKNLHKNALLSKLIISENNLSDAIGQSLYDLLIKSSGLEVLVINWNQLGSTTGIFIAKALLVNRVLKVLDLSYNRIGSNEKSNCISFWCQALLNTQLSLVHLDISYNQLSEKQIRQLNDALLKNNSLYGIHLEGNKFEGFIDPYGFIQFQQINEEFSQIKYQIDGVNYIPESTRITTQNCCWICQGWVEHRFQYTPDIEQPDTPIFLHLDFLNYKPIPMTSSSELKAQLIEQQKEQLLKKDVQQKQQNSPSTLNVSKPQERKSSILSKEILDELQKFCYSTYQMCPPKQRILYFFSNPLIEQYFIEPSQDNIPSPQDNLTLQGKDPKHQFHYFSDGTVLKFKKIAFVNQLFTKQEFIIDDKNNYKPLIRLFPRSSEKKYVLRRMGNNLKRKQLNYHQWNIEESLFKQQFQQDNEEILNECFQFDWNCSKINRFVKNDYEQMKLKEYLRENYQLIKDIYKFYSSNGYFQSECFSISFQSYIKMIQQIGIIDNESVKLQDVEIDLASIKNNIDPKYLYNPEKALIRFQFLEMFFRLANDKYVRTNIVKNHADAVYRLIREFKEHFKNFDTCQKWRDERYWNKECECLIQFKTPFLKKLYDYVTDLNNRKWYFKMKWVAIKEFKDFCKQMGLMDYINEKLIVIIYNFSMMSQADELTQDRHIRMSQLEFYEALARLAEYVSPGPVGEITEATSSSRYSLPLHVKLETLLTHIYFNVVKRSPQFTVFYDLFTNISKQDWLPKIKVSKKTEQEEEPSYLNYQDTLTVYNAALYCAMHKQPYLNPNYQSFLRKGFLLVEQSPRRSTLLSPKSPVQILRIMKKSGFGMDEPRISPPLSPRARSPSLRKQGK
ncbi:unnamed protein product (macronuclear) [Paramecium tetraurelia]|uniref:Leucine Rich Repeat family protein n=1 Tax=Paramecium tetraurelia TaxID=5888 RepID=A0CL54_PARTE|nr:uncharacterized protein GSPATT00008068001 [Paramecium tetraurelia]CAK71521.1 unnamed protein product [Paramecium tetraurelia]|eukprot:XP_001438918.1 hypothetical protein (macronuclear) [Paramecium tetraurelia strain d4-2]